MEYATFLQVFLLDPSFFKIIFSNQFDILKKSNSSSGPNIYISTIIIFYNLLHISKKSKSLINAYIKLIDIIKGDQFESLTRNIINNHSQNNILKNLINLINKSF